jgi:cytochrome P450
VLSEDTVLGGTEMKAGTFVIIPIYAIHRHHKLWDDPDRFDPTRFFEANEAKQARAQFMPFGFGARTCIGMAFAMMEGVALLGTLVRHARFDWDGKHLPEPLSRITLRPAGGMPLKVYPR